ncbi:MAG: long-chain-fatty-acid--CoA ligase [Motiliproteus sp.]
MLSLNQMLARTVRMSPNAPAITFEGRTKTWREYETRCARLGGALARLGIVAGDRVAVMSKNTDRLAELFFGPAYIGAVNALVNFRWALPEMIACVEDCTPKVLICDRDHWQQALALQVACPCIETLIYADEGETPAGFQNYETLLAAAEPAVDGGFGGDDLAALFFTGGTTGRSKGVMVSHANIYLTALVQSTNSLVCDDAAFLMIMPIFHLAGAARLYTSVMLETQVVLHRDFNTQQVLQDIQDHRITHLFGAPAILNFLINDPSFVDKDLSSLRQLMYGASPMSETLLRSVLALFPGIYITQGYGMTETGPCATVLGNSDHDPDGPKVGKLTSVGRPTLQTELRVVDSEGNACPANTVGEVALRGPCVMQGYWKLPELTAEVLRDGWYYSGDGAYLDEDGYLFLVDRVKDMIVSGGENVYSLEVESVIYQHPAIMECAVIGIPNETWGEAVHAIVTLKKDQSVTEKALIDFCREHIAGFKCPRSVTIRSEPMPLSGANKILKKELRDPFWKK